MNEENMKEEIEEEIVEIEQEPIEGEIATDDEDNEELVGIPEPDSLEAQLEHAKQEADEYRDKWVRGQAEFSNARKRMEKQRAETYTHATVDTIKKMLPVWDDLARALDHMPAELEGNTWIEGINMVQRKFVTTLENIGIKPIEAVGQPFDPLYHEAIMEEASDEYESGVVCKELQSGYQLGEQVIRPSLVYVAA